MKDTEPAELVQAVRVVAAGKALPSPNVTRRLIAEFAARAKQPQPAGGVERLTEREVVALVGEGLSNQRSPSGWLSAGDGQDPREPGRQH